MCAFCINYSSRCHVNSANEFVALRLTFHCYMLVFYVIFTAVTVLALLRNFHHFDIHLWLYICVYVCLLCINYHNLCHCNALKIAHNSCLLHIAKNWHNPQTFHCLYLSI